MAFKFDISLFMAVTIGFILLALSGHIKCSPKRSGGYSGGGWGKSSGSNTQFGGGWRSPSSSGNTGGQYSGGGWSIPSKTNSGGTGTRYSGGGWNAPSNPSNVNKVNHYSGGGWNSPSNKNIGDRYSGGGGGYSSKNDFGKQTKKGGAKNFIKKNWKKAAAFGVGAYAGYKISEGLGKLFNPNVFNYNGVQYGFNTWDRNARIDGWVCRNDGDCNWLDKHLQCETNGFSLSQITGAWPWKQELRGRCSCQNGYLFDQNNGTCYQPSGAPSWLIAIISIVIFFGLVGCCCLCVCKLMR